MRGFILSFAAIVFAPFGCDSTPPPPPDPCQPWLLDRQVTQMVSGQNNPTELIVDHDNLDWVTENDNGTSDPMSAPLDGGPPTTLAAGQIGASEIAADETSVYWLVDNVKDAPSIFDGGLDWDGGRTTVMKAALTGGPPTMLASEPGLAGDIAIDPTHVYWTTLSGRVNSAALDGSRATTLASGQELPCGLAVDATSVYWAVWNQGTIMKVGLDGGAPVALASGQDSPCRLAVDDANVYWATSDDPPLPSAIMGVSVGGGAPRTLASLTSASTAGPVSDGTNVYWAGPDDTEYAYAVKKVPLDGGSPVVVASYPTIGQIHGLAVDGTSAYWTSVGSGCGSGSVMRVSPK